jgi:hypothetical protein
MAAFVVANVAQTTWLWIRSRPAERQVADRDSQLAFLEPSEAPAD